MSRLNKDMYKPKDENVRKLKEYLNKQECVNNTIYIAKKDES